MAKSPSIGRVIDKILKLRADRAGAEKEAARRAGERYFEREQALLEALSKEDRARAHGMLLGMETQAIREAAQTEGSEPEAEA